MVPIGLRRISTGYRLEFEGLRGAQCQNKASDPYKRSDASNVLTSAPPRGKIIPRPALRLSESKIRVFRLTAISVLTRGMLCAFAPPREDILPRPVLQLSESKIGVTRLTARSVLTPRATSRVPFPTTLISNDIGIE